MNDVSGLKILRGNHAVLRETLDVDATEWPSTETIEAAVRLCDNENGVGLAANQLGITDPWFIMRAPGWDEYDLFVNPVIVDVGGNHEYDKEGCLSRPGIRVPVRRFERVAISFDVPGFVKDNRSVRWFTGYEARIVQHEMDHLSGVLITDHKRNRR